MPTPAPVAVSTACARICPDALVAGVWGDVRNAVSEGTARAKPAGMGTMDGTDAFQITRVCSWGFEFSS
jgi:hypothetical protein